MFTGIIKNLGKIKEFQESSTGAEILIEALGDFPAQKKGNSIAVDGTCLTVTNEGPDLKFFVMNETLDRTISTNYKKDTIVNMETPLKVGDELHGHMIQGHVDFVGTIKSVKKDGESKIIEISFTEEYSKYIATKGSITVNGVSLTVSKINTSSFEVSLIPETQSSTNLGNLQTGDQVNIEIDMVSRYLDRLLQDRAKQTTYEFLKERNFI